MNEYIDGCKKVEGKGVLEFTFGEGEWIEAVSPAQPNYADGQSAVEIISIEIDPAGEPPDYSNEWGQACTFRTLGDISSTIFFYTTFKDQFDKWRWRINPDVASGSTCIEDTSDPDPSPSPSCTPFDPTQYQYARYVGKMYSSNAGEEGYTAYFGNYVDDAGNIETDWYEQTEDNAVLSLGNWWSCMIGTGGGIFGPIEYWMGGENVCNNSGYNEIDWAQDGAAITLKTTFSPTVNYAFYDTVCGIGGNLSVPWRANIQITTMGISTYADNSVYGGGILGRGYSGPNLGYRPYPSIHESPAFRVAVDAYINRSGTRSAWIRGHWEFSNDQVTVEATWSGVNDKGQDIDFLKCTGYDSTVCPALPYNPTWLSNPCPRLEPPIGPELTCPELPGPPEDLDPPIDIPEPDPEPGTKPTGFSCCNQVDSVGRLYSTRNGGWYQDPNWSDQTVHKINRKGFPALQDDGNYAYTIGIIPRPGDVFTVDLTYIAPNSDANFCIRDYEPGQCKGGENSDAISIASPDDDKNYSYKVYYTVNEERFGTVNCTDDSESSYYRFNDECATTQTDFNCTNVSVIPRLLSRQRLCGSGDSYIRLPQKPLLRVVYFTDTTPTIRETYYTRYGSGTWDGSFGDLRPIQKWIYINKIVRINHTDNNYEEVVWKNNNVPEWDADNLSEYPWDD